MFKSLDRYNGEILVFLLSVSWLTLHWFSVFPALYSWDIFFYLKSIFDFNGIPGKINWESFLYEVYVYLMASISTRLTLATFFQILLFSGLATKFFSFLKTDLKMPKLSFLFVVVFILVPPNVYFALMTERDNLFAWSGFLGLLLVAKFALKNNQQNVFSDYLKLFAIFAIMVAFRKDALLILIALPVLFFHLKKSLNVKNLSKAYIVTIVVVGGYSWFTAQLSRDQEIGIGQKYNISATLSSFLYIFAKEKDTLSMEDQKFLFSFIKSDLISSPERALFLNIGEFDKIDKVDELERIHSMAIKAIIQHPLLFLESRILVFRPYFTTPMFVSPLASSGKNKFAFAYNLHILKKYNLISENILPHFNFLTKPYFYHSHNKDSFLFMISNPIYILIFTILCGFYFVRSALAGTLAMMSLLHAGVIFFLQPGGGVKYLYFSYMAIFLIIPVLIYEVRKKREASKAVENLTPTNT